VWRTAGPFPPPNFLVRLVAVGEGFVAGNPGFASVDDKSWGAASLRLDCWRRETPGFSLVVNVEQPLLDRGGDRLGPIGDLQLFNDAIDVIPGSIGTDFESRADLLVGEPL
jgi:hypothetical protein